MEKMTTRDLVDYMTEFIYENDLWKTFVDKMNGIGYSEEEVDEAIEKTKSKEE